MSRNILIAYDGSDLSRKAIYEAKSLVSEKPGTKVHILSVIKPTGPITNAQVSRNIAKELSGEFYAEIQPLKEEFETDADSVITDVIIGDTEDNPGIHVCQYASDHDIDLIIIGSRGLGNVKKMILGSVSNNVVQNSTCPVLVMK